MVCIVVQRIVTDQILTVVIGKAVEKHVGKYFEPGKGSESLGSRFLFTKDFYTLFELFVQMKFMDTTAEKRKGGWYGAMHMERNANIDAFMAADDSFGQEATAPTSLKSSSKESNISGRSQRNRYIAPWPGRRNKMD